MFFKKKIKSTIDFHQNYILEIIVVLCDLKCYFKQFKLKFHELRLQLQ